jgi:hypothetical protein
MHESTTRRIMVQVSLGIKQDPISKITRAKRASGVTQVVEHLLRTWEALSSTPSTAHTAKIRKDWSYIGVQCCLV